MYFELISVNTSNHECIVIDYFENVTFTEAPLSPDRNNQFLLMYLFLK